MNADWLEIKSQVNGVISQAQSVKCLADDANYSCTLAITEACSLHGAIKKLTTVTRNLQTTIDARIEATERSGDGMGDGMGDG